MYINVQLGRKILKFSGTELISVKDKLNDWDTEQWDRDYANIIRIINDRTMKIQKPLQQTYTYLML